MFVNRAPDLASVFNDEDGAVAASFQTSSPHQQIAGLVLQWQGLREALKEQGMTDEERLIYVRANIKVLHKLKKVLDDYPQAPKEIRMVLSREEVERNWKELCEERHALFTFEILKETESVEILLKRYKEFSQNESNAQHLSELKTETIARIAQVIDKSIDVASNTNAIHDATDIHLMIYVDNLSYLALDNKLTAMRDILGETLLFKSQLTSAIKGDTQEANIQKRFNCLQGFLCLRRMVDNAFPFNFINKTREAYELSLKGIRKGGYDIFGTDFYHALNMNRLQMYGLVEDLYSPFLRLSKPKRISPPKPEVF